MANATIESALVLDRFKGSFVDKATNETIIYAQARIFDLESRDIMVVSAKDPAALKEYEPGLTIGPIDVEVMDMTTIRVTKVRPAGVAGGAGQERF